MIDNKHVGNIWWSKMINASRFLEDIRNSVYDRKSIAVTFGSYLPWENYLLEEKLPTLLRENDWSSGFDVYDDKDIKDPTDFIWEKYFSQQAKNYWEPTHKCKERFMATVKDTSLNQCYVVIKNVSESRFAKWNKFLNEYIRSFSTDTAEKGVFILLGRDLTVPATSKIERISFSDYITDFDCLVFCMTLLSTQKLDSVQELDSVQKQYIAELTNELSQGNVEISTNLLSHGENLATSTFDLATSTFDTAVKVEKEMGISNHQIRNAVNSALWKTQIKFIFGLIEEFREKYINNNYNAIFAHLPKVGTFGEKFENPRELEIKYLYDIDSKHIHKESFALGVLKTARNNLAHLSVLPYDDILKIIKIVKEYK